MLLGTTEPVLAGSRYAVERGSARSAARLPALDLARHADLLGLVVEVVGGDEVVGHSRRLGRRAGAGAGRMRRAGRSRWGGDGGGVGFTVSGVADGAELFSESPSRVVCCTARPDAVLDRGRPVGVPAAVIGTTGGDRLVVEGLLDVGLEVATSTWQGALPDALGESPAA